ncbi:MAG: hypothetical protein JWO48_386 [Bryobacterales bacterium]|nr:hypothetical protein [Bryobacterales bacterium]
MNTCDNARLAELSLSRAHLKQQMRLTRLVVLLLLSVAAHAADVCGRNDLYGPYGFQFSGTTTISGSETPVAGLGRIEFGDDGAVSGISSVNFNGLYLGNPVTGTYEFGTDCRMSMNLQDDSGAFQHFSGTVTPGGKKVTFHQTDPGTGERGIMLRTSDSCTDTDFRPSYAFTMSGVYTPLAPDGASGTISAGGTIDAASSGSPTLTIRLRNTDATASGTFNVESNCLVDLEFTLPEGDGQPDIPMKLRGILVDEGKEILAISSDPAVTSSARFTAR